LSRERDAACVRERRRRAPSGRALAAGSWVLKATAGGGDEPAAQELGDRRR